MGDEQTEEDQVFTNTQSTLLIVFPASSGHSQDRCKSVTGQVPFYFSPAI